MRIVFILSLLISRMVEEVLRKGFTVPEDFRTAVDLLLHELPQYEPWIRDEYFDALCDRFGKGRVLLGMANAQLERRGLPGRY